MNQSVSLVKDTVVRLLGNMANQREIEQYLKRFSSVGQSRFAVIKVGGGIIQNDLENLCSSLSFLHRIGLSPIVIHGGGPQLTDKLQQQNITSTFKNGSRVTSAEVLKVARKTFLKINLQLVEALQNANVKATSISGGIFDASLNEDTSLGFVGNVNNVHLEPILDSLKAGSIPVISSLGETDSGQIVNINADVATNELVLAVKPYKIIFLTQTGGLLDGNNKIIHSINLSSDFENLISQPWVHGGMELKLKQAASILNKLPLSSSISITEPAHLAKELFTHRGSGTLIRKGETIHHFTNWNGLDKQMLKVLIENSFNKKLCADYFEQTRLSHAYVTDSYRAAALITSLELDDSHSLPFLDKYVVADDAKGEGLGRAVWNTVREQHQQLVWRSRKHNAINQFYFRQSDGCYKSGEWIVFWYGIREFDVIQQCIAATLKKTATVI